MEKREERRGEKKKNKTKPQMRKLVVLEHEDAEQKSPRNKSDYPTAQTLNFLARLKGYIRSGSQNGL